MIARFLLAGALAIASISTARASDVLLWEFDTAGWEGGAYSYANGRFSHCYIAAPYKSGIFFGMGLTADYHLRISLGHEDWRLPADARYDVNLYIDNREIGRFPSSVYETHHLIIDIGKRADVYQRLRAGYQLRVAAAKDDFYFNLDGTSRALEKVRECVSVATAFSQPNSNPFAGDSGGRGMTNPFSSSNDGTAASSDQDLVEGLLLASGLDEVNFVDPAVLQFDGANYAWTSGDLTGLVYVVDPEGSAIDTFANELLGIFASSCEGTFGSQSPASIPAGRGRLKQFSAACRAPGVGDAYYAGTALGYDDSVLIFLTFSSAAPEVLRDVNDSLANVFTVVLAQ
ncbi:MAG: hypothetical protein ACFCUT_06755 [Kiloniellaceae bacterium]